MNCCETEHYLFYYGPGTRAEADIKDIARMQEACREHICRVLKTELPFRIRYFLCDSPEEVGRVYGDNEPCNGFAALPDAVYAVYNENVRCIGFHEDAHIISETVGHPAPPAIREGLAMYFDRKWWGISNWEWAGYYLKRNGSLPAAVWLDRKAFFGEDCSLTYPVMGAFTEYLISTYGLDLYLRLYREWESSKTLEAVYGKTPAALQAEFEGYVGLFRVDSVVEVRMEELLGG